MTWLHGPLRPFDLETTGPDPDWARIVTATIVELTPGDPWTVEHREFLADPGVDIPAGAAAVHGITTERARAEGSNPEDVVDEVTSALEYAMSEGIPVIGHNLSYDLTVLDRECRRHGVPTLEDRLGVVAPVVDTMVLDKAMHERRRGSRKLVDVAAFYGVALAAEDAHDATADAMASARILWKMAGRYPRLAASSLEELHQRQVVWRAAQCASLQDYFRRQGKADAVVDGSWPCAALPEGWDPDVHPVEEPVSVA